MPKILVKNPEKWQKLGISQKLIARNPFFGPCERPYIQKANLFLSIRCKALYHFLASHYSITSILKFIL